MPEELLQTKAEVIGAIATIFQVLFYVGLACVAGASIWLFRTVRHR